MIHLRSTRAGAVLSKLKSIVGFGTPVEYTWNEKLFVDHAIARSRPLNTPRVMVNVGAHLGLEAFERASHGWDVYAFEANPKNSAALEKAVSESTLPKKPIFIPEAISLKEQDTVTFYVSDRYPGIGSLTRFTETHRPIKVKARTLKSFYQERNIKAIDYFLMDAERMDFRIIQTHDWSIPIGVLVLEFTASYLRNLVEYVTQQDPTFKHTIFMYKKEDGQFWERGKPNPVRVIGRVTIDEYERRRAEPNHPEFSTWGNVVFYRD
jgi:FkbM family methyltransferase